MPDDDPGELIPVPEAIRRYKISRSTIERAISGGKLRKYTQLGTRGRLLSVAQLDQLTTPTPTE